ncbi:MAG: lipid-A-disaccharide synthase, partial [Gammaproteobacteria bacterium]|nr:lipid-A-disaccharide synthase [Gammaproteobacteria bacterium]
MPRIAIVVGEASGDQLGRGLIEALRAKIPNAEFVGVTGPQMRAAGCESWNDYEPLAVMGLVEVIRHIPGLLRLQRQLKARLRDERPDVLIGIDAPDFNLRLERYARDLGIPTVHYVCPSVWAWRQSRVKTLRRACDRVLCLLPFEAGFLQSHDVDGVFVGHPLADELAEEPDQQNSCQELGLSTATDRPCLALLPGSRGTEVALLGPLFLDTVVWLRERQPGLQVAVAAANDRLAEDMMRGVSQAGLADCVSVFTGKTRAVLASADAVLLASGTATLETMLMRRPMVVAYRMNALTAWLARRLVKVEYAALPNLLAGCELVPEFLQEEAQPEALGAAVLTQLQSGDERAATLQRFAELAARLRQNASGKAADA